MPEIPEDKKWLRRLLPPLAAALTFAVFLPALDNGFVNWDDFENLVGNQRYRGLGREQLSWMFTTFHLGHYQPLTWVTFGFDHLVWGMNPFGYHLTSALLHSLNALVFCALCGRLLAAAVPPAPGEKATGLLISASFAALFFALHPLRVESVAWATERRDVLSGLFYLLALLWYLPRPGDGEKAEFRRRNLLAPFAFLLSLLSKSIGMTLPVVLVALDIYPLRRLPADPRRWFAPEHRKLWLEKLPFAALAAVFAALAYISADRSGVIVSYQQHGFGSRAAQGLYAAGFYLWKSLVPLDLSPLYRLPPGFGLASPQAVFSGAAIAAVTAAVIALRRSFPAGAATWFIYLATLSPVLGLVKGGPQAVADRYTYLSCLGFAVLAGAGLRAGLRAGRPLSLASSFLACLIISGHALLTWRQQRVWRDSETLWTHAVAVNPEADFPRGILGMVLDNQGKFKEAAAQYREALRLNPGLWKAHNYLGADLAALGELDQAVGHFREAVKLNPDYAEAENNLGSALNRLGKHEEAVTHYREALRLNPGYYKAHNNLAISLSARGRPEQAIRHYREALKIAPAYADAHNNLAGLLGAQGRLDEAAGHCLEAIRLNPGFAEAHFNLSLILARQGKRDEAVRHRLRALELDPRLGGAPPGPDKARQPPAGP